MKCNEGGGGDSSHCQELILNQPISSNIEEFSLKCNSVVKYVSKRVNLVATLQLRVSLE